MKVMINEGNESNHFRGLNYLIKEKEMSVVD